MELLLRRLGRSSQSEEVSDETSKQAVDCKTNPTSSGPEPVRRADVGTKDLEDSMKPLWVRRNAFRSMKNKKAVDERRLKEQRSSSSSDLKNMQSNETRFLNVIESSTISKSSSSRTLSRLPGAIEAVRSDVSHVPSRTEK